MLRGLNIAGAGLASAQLRSEVAGHNLANAGTADFRRRVVATGSFTEMMITRVDGEASAALGPMGGGPAVAAQGQDTVQEALPGSGNVDPTREMVELMAAVRVFEALQRTVLAQDEAARKAATDIGRVF